VEGIEDRSLAAEGMQSWRFIGSVLRRVAAISGEIADSFCYHKTLLAVRLIPVRKGWNWQTQNRCWLLCCFFMNLF
jgi:hypothetical protein